MNDEQAVQSILSLKIVEQLNSCRALEEQVAAADRNIEALHDYRVALRRSRALLELFSDAYPPRQYKALRNSLKELAHHTNRLRDLDVFIALHDQYQAWLPKKCREDLSQFFQALAASRQQQVEKQRCWLASYGYKKSIQQLVEFFSEHARNPTGLTSNKQVKKAVKARIARQQGKISAIAREVQQHGKQRKVHQLRIECKKLRYLIEAFAELFKNNRFRDQLRQLKQLQDVLGQFNDYSVQLALIESYSQLLPDKAGADFLTRLQKKLTNKKLSLQDDIVALPAWRLMRH